MKIVIILGDGTPAVSAGNVYLSRLQSEHSLVYVQQKNLSFFSVKKFLLRHFRKYGFFECLNVISLRLYSLLFVRNLISKPSYENSLNLVSLNDGRLRKFLSKHQPELVVTTGCGVLGKRVLKSISVPIINSHCGVCPRYRGMGNIWALVENEIDLLGTTIHYVNEGIDTGEIISSSKLQLAKKDLFDDLDRIFDKSQSL